MWGVNTPVFIQADSFLFLHQCMTCIVYSEPALCPTKCTSHGILTVYLGNVLIYTLVSVHFDGFSVVIPTQIPFNFFLLLVVSSSTDHNEATKHMQDQA